jgi:DNA-binding transcriptional ArsR family regulator
MQFDNVIIFAYLVATSRNFLYRVTMSKTASFQHMTEAALKLIAARFRALGEVSRLKLIFAAGNGEKNVTELIAVTGLSQANVSKHLHILTDSGILIRRQRGIFVYYSSPDLTFQKLCAVGQAGLRKHSD